MSQFMKILSALTLIMIIFLVMCDISLGDSTDTTPAGNGISFEGAKTFIDMQIVWITILLVLISGLIGWGIFRQYSIAKDFEAERTRAQEEMDRCRNLIMDEYNNMKKTRENYDRKVAEVDLELKSIMDDIRNRMGIFDDIVVRGVEEGKSAEQLVKLLEDVIDKWKDKDKVCYSLADLFASSAQKTDDHNLKRVYKTLEFKMRDFGMQYSSNV